MTDEQIENRLSLIISEMGILRENRALYARPLQDAKRIAAIAIASGNTRLLKNAQVIEALANITKPTVSIIEYLTELECGEFAFQDAVIDAQMKMLVNELEAIKTLSIHAASQRKAERI